MKRLIINADDFGYTDGVCRAITELMASQAVTTTSFMAAVPGSFNRARRWSLNDHIGRVGVHLQLTSGTPLSPPQHVQSLIDTSTGSFRPKSHLPYVDPNEVLLEWTRQVDLTYKILDGPPTHLDSHHGAHRHPHLAEAFMKLAERFGLAVRGGDEDLNAMLLARNIPVPDAIIRNWTGRSLGVTELRRQIEQAFAANATCAVLVTHPGYCDEDLARTSSMNAVREHDMSALIELSTSGWLDDNDIILSTFSALNFPDRSK